MILCRLHGHHPIMESLSRCSDMLIRFNSTSDVDHCLEYLRDQCDRQLFYTRIKVRKSPCRSWPTLEWNWYPTDHTRYALAMLHSLGYVFDDKYLSSDPLQITMLAFAEENERRFYPLALKAFHALKDDHGLDLNSIFNQTEFDQIPEEVNESSQL